MFETQTPNFTGSSSFDILNTVMDPYAQVTDCQRQHTMYEHLDLFFNHLNGVNSTQNLSALLKHDPCYSPIFETNMTVSSSSWIIDFDFWCSGILINLVGMVGILGNSLSLIILSRPQMRSSINYLLIALARCDIILIITSMFLFGFHSIYPYSFYDDTGGSMFWFRYTYNVYPRIIKYLFTLAVIAQTANCYLTLLVSLERFVAVCHPLRARALCTYGRSKFYVIFCTVVAVLYNLIRFEEIESCGDQHPDYGQIYCTRMTPLRTSTAYIKYYIHWSALVVNHIIPFSGLLIFNTMIYAQVRKANRERQMWSRTERREIGLATMLLCVVVVFILFNSLALYANFVEAFFDEIPLEIVIISNLLVTLNSSVNFIIYVIFGEKFKRIFLQLFCEGRIGRESPDGIVQEDSSYSNGDGNRSSSRLSRHGTQRTSLNLRNGTSLKIKRINRIRAPTQDPCVYYPARDISRTTEITKLGDKNGNITSDLL
ncbi:FMRFamide receptor [Contarinia nasturtii]|uniref:FMRFamide receptor n=1 Tax=Contarinia nasturtii TaxID=265458 RepID=UPI0012D39AB6|nr:FMRFamide receptor [Contarinia nasturtii]XP_031636402.1 FMRFamide receptor [Contarinia nasturtii]